MFAHMIDDFKESTGSALRLTSLAAAAALALFVTTSFICAAVFVFVLDKYGLVEACLAGAGRLLRGHADRRLLLHGAQEADREAGQSPRGEAAKSAVHSMLADPMVMAAGLQVIRAIGVKRLIPILAVGGVALGFLASRNTATGDEAPAE